jgi:hypothetical protein
MFLHLRTKHWQRDTDCNTIVEFYLKKKKGRKKSNRHCKRKRGELWPGSTETPIFIQREILNCRKNLGSLCRRG